MWTWGIVGKYSLHFGAFCDSLLAIIRSHGNRICLWNWYQVWLGPKLSHYRWRCLISKMCLEFLPLNINPLWRACFNPNGWQKRRIEKNANRSIEKSWASWKISEEKQRTSTFPRSRNEILGRCLAGMSWWYVGGLNSGGAIWSPIQALNFHRWNFITVTAPKQCTVNDTRIKSNNLHDLPKENSFLLNYNVLFLPPTKTPPLKKSNSTPPIFPLEGGGISTPDPDDPQSSEHGLHAMLIVGYNDRQEVPLGGRISVELHRGFSENTQIIRTRKIKGKPKFGCCFTCWRVEVSTCLHGNPTF